MPPSPTPLWNEAWKKLRPRALSGLIEFGLYLRLFLLLLGEHIVRVIFGAAGVDPDVINDVAWMEKWTFRALFASFFFRILIGVFYEKP